MDVFTYLSLNTSWFMLVKSTPGTTDVTPILGGIIGYVESPKHGGCLSHTNCTMKSDTSLVIYQHDVFDTFIGIYKKNAPCHPMWTSFMLHSCKNFVVAWMFQIWSFERCCKFNHSTWSQNLTRRLIGYWPPPPPPPPHTHTLNIQYTFQTTLSICLNLAHRDIFCRTMAILE